MKSKLLVTLLLAVASISKVNAELVPMTASLFNPPADSPVVGGWVQYTVDNNCTLSSVCTDHEKTIVTSMFGTVAYTRSAYPIRVFLNIRGHVYYDRPIECPVNTAKITLPGYVRPDTLTALPTSSADTGGYLSYFNSWTTLPTHFPFTAYVCAKSDTYE